MIELNTQLHVDYAITFFFYLYEIFFTFQCVCSISILFLDIEKILRTVISVFYFQAM